MESVLFNRPARRSAMLRRAFETAAVGWAIALPLATWIAARPHPSSVPYALAFGVYGLGAWICHQRPERSFYLWAMQMPVCARCAGIYVGAALAAVAPYVALGFKRAGLAPLKRRPTYARPTYLPTVNVRTVLIAAALPTLLTLAFEWTTAVTPPNWVRALAGLPIGAAVAWMVQRPEVN